MYERRLGFGREINLLSALHALHVNQLVQLSYSYLQYYIASLHNTQV